MASRDDNDPAVEEFAAGMYGQVFSEPATGWLPTKFNPDGMRDGESEATSILSPPEAFPSFTNQREQHRPFLLLMLPSLLTGYCLN